LLGRDDNDRAQSCADQYLDRVLEVEHVLTVEPGLYSQLGALVPGELSRIGISAGNDVVVTQDSYLLLRELLPGQPDEIES
jgi:Xaa-Pro aminopeptidase